MLNRKEWKLYDPKQKFSVKTKITVRWIIVSLASIMILFLLVLLHDSRDKTPIKKVQYFNNKTVNDIVKTILEVDSTFEHVSVVLNETEPMLLNPNDDENPDGLIYPPPPPDDTWFSRKDFNRWIKMDIITSEEADCMFSSIDPFKRYLIDSMLINKSVFSREKHDELFTKYSLQDAYGMIRAQYGTSCLAKFGTPLFNEDSTKVLLTVSHYCGSLDGFGLLLILKKVDDIWQIIYKEETWVS